MKERHEKIFFILLRIFIALAVAGLIALVVTNLREDPSVMAFSTIAFVISVAALVMTTLQSVSIARQLRITQRSARLVHETTNRLEDLVREDQALGRALRKDIALDHSIIEVLEEYGIGETDHDRREVAQKVAHRLRQSQR